ncbi:Membrane-associated guanylate kinase, WW and PDZ domain-containing protein 2 [Sciurus carolinensis]|uniref:Membrane-associated guanylate kinase, WW and PDZ domain-containing protein 2 n=1 Tax=Sciurus carolinensis TaxID=30640 RepID=A0AA41MT88_SCICA|nr:Membrane-associated guanylate kinase, WW and PDZ domain-containing protein 2 [Sciurus carolinensis]
MSKSLKKKSHWTSKVHESVIGRNPEGQLGFELKGGAENGQFPYLGEVKPGKVAYESGSKLVSEELLLEVNETPVAGLTIRDVLAVIKHCKDPLRLKCVKQVRPSPLEGIRPCLTSSELPGQIECASVASPAVDEELLGKEGGKE